MIPYQNPNQNLNYASMYQQPMYNPYMQRMEQIQQSINATMQNQQFSTIGKIVESIEMVKATDIPMDGNMYYFPKADGSEIFGKQWLANGQTRILTFKPALEDNASILSGEDEKTKFDAFLEVLDGIQSDIKALNDKVDKISKTTKAKKEVAEDE